MCDKQVSEHGNEHTETMGESTRPGADWVQADIARSVDLRKEYYKYTIGIATALLAFTISFPPSLTSVSSVLQVQIAWIALGITILCGVAAHYAWSKFFISFRDLDNRGDHTSGVNWRKKLTTVRRILEIVQFVTLFIGVLGIAWFASSNFGHIALHSGDKPTTVASCATR